jgi:hypothetical protein
VLLALLLLLLLLLLVLVLLPCAHLCQCSQCLKHH